MPDPNTFGGPVKVRRAGAQEWSEIPLTHRTSRTAGASAWPTWPMRCTAGRPHRASGALAYHVLDVMHAFEDASNAGKHIAITSGVPQPAALPLGLRHGTLDE